MKEGIWELTTTIMPDIEGYCIKLKKKVVLQKPITHKKNPNGTYMFKGKCPETGSTVCAIKGAADAEKLIAAKVSTPGK